MDLVLFLKLRLWKYFYYKEKEILIFFGMVFIKIIMFNLVGKL